jgi:hypothetical protein
MRAAWLSLVLPLAALCPACDQGALLAPTDTLLRVEGGQFFDGAPPVDQSGPKVSVFDTSNRIVRTGAQGKVVFGDVPAGAQAVLLSLEGDRGHWLVPTGLSDPLLPGLISFSARLSFAARLPAGPRTLEARAVDAQGRAGKAEALSLRLVDLDPAQAATLAFTLEWDANADLDLHVVDPTGVEVWARNVNSAKSGAIPDPAAVAAGGVLDLDSNSMCVLDGRRRETVYWTQPPPSGAYTVRVDAWSLCGEAAAWWHLTARQDGAVVAESRGVVLDADAARPHGAGSGTTALSLQVP